MITRDNAERRQTEATALLNQALTLVQTHLAALTSALDAAEKLTAEAQAIAKEFNRHSASDWVLAEDCGVTFARIGSLDVRRNLQNMADIKMTPCTVEPGVLVKLSANLKYQDLPQGAVTAISEKECQRLEKDFLVWRVPVPASAEGL